MNVREIKRLAHDHNLREGKMEDQTEDWTQKKWRPMMGWVYMVTCIFDFILAPILWSIIQVKFKGNITEAWMPLTLQGAGLYHLAMGAILGVAAWSRGQEKIATTRQFTSSTLDDNRVKSNLPPKRSISTREEE